MWRESELVELDVGLEIKKIKIHCINIQLYLMFIFTPNNYNKLKQKISIKNIFYIH